VKQIRRRAHFLECGIGQGIEVIDQRLERRGGFLKGPNYCNGHLYCCQRLARGVVQFAGYAPAFFVLERHETQGEPEQFFLSVLADFHLGFEPGQSLKEFLRAGLHSLFELIVRDTQLALDVLSFFRLPG
jgi:hypothetical protein